MKTWLAALHSSRTKSQQGLTLIELLIVVVIVAVLIILVVFAVLPQLSRSRDAERKGDLEKIKVAFEDYYNDVGCYPPADVLNSCDSEAFKPYIDKIPCDPATNTPYLYVPLDGSPCQGYRVFASLEDKTDEIIARLGCDGADGCGFGSDFNYGVSAGVVVSTGTGGSSGGTSSPRPSGTVIYVYACDAAGACNQYAEGHEYLVNCPITFSDRNCGNGTGCLNPANYCH